MKQATFITGLSCVGFAVALAVFIGSRLSEQAVALMAGAFFGLIVALPIGVLIGWAVKGSRSFERTAAPSQPMVILTPPQQLPSAAPYAAASYAAASTNPAWHGAYPVAPNMPQPRKYTIGGEEIVNHESLAVW